MFSVVLFPREWIGGDLGDLIRLTLVEAEEYVDFDKTLGVK